ncbi:MAG: class I SAM-dependent methyltransferase [Kineosporiaceae bacterium]
MPSSSERIPIALTGVPETLLWTLYFRAQEASRPDTVLHDPLAVELVERIDYPFEARLGRGVRRAQWQGLRSRTFDEQIRRFLAAHPGGTVVALGEGLETQFWRVDDGHVRWVSVDLPESAAVQRRVLPRHERRREIAASALDEGWMNELRDEQVDAHDVLITAQGLLMYLPREQVHALITRLAAHVPGARMLLDGVPRWATRATALGQRQRRARQADSADSAIETDSTAETDHGAEVPEAADPFQAPVMHWWLDDAEADALRALPGVADVRRLHPPRGRGLVHALALPIIDRLPGLRSQVLSIWSLRFAGAADGLDPAGDVRMP